MPTIFDEPPCRVCGCTDDNCYCCVMHTGASCWWVALDLCSACDGRTTCPGDIVLRVESLGVNAVVSSNLDRRT